MREIRPLADADWDAYVTVTLNAYPGFKAQPERVRERAIKMSEDPVISFWGLFDQGKLLGAMRLYDFSMKLHDTVTLVGGVGGVAVDLLHKKEKVAYEMLQFFLRHYRERGACLTALYPFRPDFYKQMGFGYGRKMNQYRLPPAHFPKGVSKKQVDLLQDTPANREALRACYDRYMKQTNGLMALYPFQIESMFTAPNLKIAACRDGEAIRGYLTFSFEAVPGGTFLRNEIVVRSLVYETPAALSELFTFLHSQADQIETVVFHTQEEDFHLLFADPRNDSLRMLPSVYHESNTQGVGIMYRVIDVPRLFAVLRGHDFGGQTVRLQLSLTDSFFPQNGGKWVLAVDHGRVQLQPSDAPFDTAVSLDVAEFSSLITGVVSFRQLVQFGLAQLSDAAYLEPIDRLFAARQKPLCQTPF